MKKILTVAAMLLSFSAFSQEDYVIKINDSTFNIALDKSYNKNINGANVSFIVRSKDTLIYEGNGYSFKYPKAFKVSETKVDDGITQIAIMTAEGSGIIIQQYETLNPTSLNEMMLTEITKESISYGFTQTEIEYKVKLQSGKELNVKKATLRYKDEVNIYEITSVGKKDAGLIIMSLRMDNDDYTEGKKLIDLMWQTLKINY